MGKIEYCLPNMDELPSSRVELKNKSDYKLKIASNTL